MILTKLIEPVNLVVSCRNDNSAFLHFLIISADLFNSFLVCNSLTVSCSCWRTWFSWNFRVSVYLLFTFPVFLSVSLCNHCSQYFPGQGNMNRLRRMKRQLRYEVLTIFVSIVTVQFGLISQTLSGQYKWCRFY